MRKLTGVSRCSSEMFLKFSDNKTCVSPDLCGLVQLPLSDVSTRSAATIKTPTFLRIAQEHWYWNSLLPEDKYLNGICMWVEVDPRRPSWFLHLSYEATETLENIPVRATLISAVAYLCRRWQEAWAAEGEEALFTLSSVRLNQFTIKSLSSLLLCKPAVNVQELVQKHTDKS